MKADCIKIGKDEKVEIHLRDAGGQRTLYVVGPGSISIIRSKKAAQK